MFQVAAPAKIRLAAFLTGLACMAVALPSLAQETGFAGFLQRAGAAVTRTATAATKPMGAPQHVDPAGAVTTGPYFRPISPAHGGRFEGLFANYRPGLSSFPRAALTFTHFGSALPCWTVTARIWQSATKHQDEVFEICNSPIEARDAIGNIATVNVGQGLQLANFLLPAQNLEGSTHAPTSTTRNNGVNPPLMFFNVPFTGPTAYAMSTQYRQMLLRLSWVSDFVDPTSPDVNSTVGKVMWTAGFDPNGNADKAAL